MPTKQSTRGRAQDRTKVAAGQPYEVNYEKRKNECVRQTGNKSGKIAR